MFVFLGNLEIFSVNSSSPRSVHFPHPGCTKTLNFYFFIESCVPDLRYFHPAPENVNFVMDGALLEGSFS